jgi:hypothetical protein
VLSKTLHSAAVLVLVFICVSCASPAPTAPLPLPASPPPTDAGAPAAVSTARSESDAGAPATAGEDPIAAEPVLLFSQPPNPDGGLILSSVRVPEGRGTSQWAWDNFIFEAPQTITEIRWRGAYDPARRGSGGMVQDFTVDIYPSIPVGSEPDVAKPPLVHYEVGGNANEKAAELAGDVQMYDYSFTLPVPFEADAYTPYWVQIEAIQSGNPDWALSKGTRGDAQHFRRILGDSSNIYQYAPGDAAFDLLAPGSAGGTAGGGVPAFPERKVTQEPLPPAEVIPINADGIQEVQMVVSRSGYTPVHFAVKAGVPVRVVFRQLGYVPGGNILLMRWGEQDAKYLELASLTDKQVLEFTPQEPGDFTFNCPHDWYEGVMTVQE